MCSKPYVSSWPESESSSTAQWVDLPPLASRHVLVFLKTPTAIWIKREMIWNLTTSAVPREPAVWRAYRSLFYSDEPLGVVCVGFIRLEKMRRILHPCWKFLGMAALLYWPVWTGEGIEGMSTWIVKTTLIWVLEYLYCRCICTANGAQPLSMKKKNNSWINK